MSLYIKVPGGDEWDCNDPTIDEIDRIERETGTPWTELRPLGGPMSMTKAYLRAAWRRSGRDPDEVGSLPVRALLDYFENRAEPGDGEGEEQEEEVPTKGRKARSHRDSSGTAPSAGAGPRLSAASSASGMSSSS